jgi:predicted AAA+ superfamily ATPase
MIDNIKSIARYNFWDGAPKLGFLRSNYLKKIISFEQSSLIKVLVGQRRVGKSFILRQYIDHLIKSGVEARNTLYINMEYTNFEFLSTHRELANLINTYFDEYKIKGKLHLFVDEVQRIDQWEKIINSLSQDYTRDIAIYITGSNSEMLSGELSSLLSGRYVKFTVFPFSFDEYVGFNSLKKTRTNYIEYLHNGGLPELSNLPNEETKRFYLVALQDTILLRDIVQRYQIKDTSLLLDIFSYLVNNFSTLFSINNVVNYFGSKNRKTNYETVSNYIQYLQNTFIIHKCERFDLKGKELLGGNVKYYVNDLAFKNLLFSGNTHGKGYLLENLVYITLLNHGFQTYVGTMRDKEIDFVAIKNDITIYIQVTYSLEDDSTAKREYSAFSKIKDHYEKWIVSLDDIPKKVQNGIRNVVAWELDDLLDRL